MKILHTCARFYPYIGGTETVVYEICTNLIKKGHEVTVVCADEPKGAPGTVDGVNIIRIPYHFKVANSNISFSILTKILKQKFDIIHTHLPHPWFADFSALASKIKKTPLFLTYHNDIIGDGLYSFIASLYNYTFLNLLLKRVKNIFVTNPSYIDSSNYLKKFKNKLVINPLGVNTKKFYRNPSIKKEKNSLFFLSVLDEFHEYKGLKLLLNAIKKIVEQGKNIKLYIGGEGILKKHYEKYSQEIGISENVFFLGYLSDKKVYEYYNRCEIFILPTLKNKREGFGLVPLEAMACGSKVIVSDIPAIAKEMGSDFVFQAEDLNGCIQTILNTLEAENISQQKLLDKFSWEKHIEILLKYYEQSLE